MRLFRIKKRLQQLNQSTRLLSESEFKSTLSENRMTDVTKTAEPVVDIWLYVEKLVEEGTVLKYVSDRHLVEHVYRNDESTVDHILLPTETGNVFIVIVVDLVEKEIRGHFRIDLNKEYGIEPKK